MKREIKFRAWCNRGKKMYNISQIEFRQGELSLIFTKGNKNPLAEPILLQFTGLKDINNKEIYEGDIVKMQCELMTDGGYYHYGVYIGKVVIIASKGVCIKNPYFENHNGKDYKMNGYYKPLTRYRTEIIGSIYENPELLK